LAFLTQNKAKLCKNLIITLFWEKRQIFWRKLTKIAENCDHNIDPSYEINFFFLFLFCCQPSQDQPFHKINSDSDRCGFFARNIALILTVSAGCIYVHLFKIDESMGTHHFVWILLGYIKSYTYYILLIIDNLVFLWWLLWTWNKFLHWFQLLCWIKGFISSGTFIPWSILT
jgi:hypothetical protein